MPAWTRLSLGSAGWEGMGVQTNVAPGQDVADGRDRGVRILLVWGVRFTGECLAELLECVIPEMPVDEKIGHRL